MNLYNFKLTEKQVTTVSATLAEQGNADLAKEIAFLFAAGRTPGIAKSTIQLDAISAQKIIDAAMVVYNSEVRINAYFLSIANTFKLQMLKQTNSHELQEVKKKYSTYSYERRAPLP